MHMNTFSDLVKFKLSLTCVTVIYNILQNFFVISSDLPMPHINYMIRTSYFFNFGIKTQNYPASMCETKQP